MAALALSALIGAGTASATELCSTLTSPCSGTMYPAGTSLSVQLVAGTNAVFTTSIGTVSCKQFDLSVKTSSTGSPVTTVRGSATAATLEGCTQSPGGAPCFAKPESVGFWALEIHTGEKGIGNGTMTLSPPTALIECELGVDCTFTTTNAVLNVIGGNPAKLQANKIPLTPKPDATHNICPSTTVGWTAEWEFTTPKPLFVI